MIFLLSSLEYQSMQLGRFPLEVVWTIPFVPVLHLPILSLVIYSIFIWIWEYSSILEALLQFLFSFYIWIIGMSSLYTLTIMSAIRCQSVLKNDKSWHLTTNKTFISLPCVYLIWGLALAIALPPIIGMGEYVIDIVMIR